MNTICGVEISQGHADALTAACFRIQRECAARERAELKTRIIRGFNEYGKQNPHNTFKGDGEAYYKKYFT